MSKKPIIAAYALLASFILLVGSVEGKDSFCCSTTETQTGSDDAQTGAANDVMKLSKAFGHLIGRNLETPGLTFNLEAIIEGMRDAAAGVDSPMTEVEYEEAMLSLQEAAFNDLAEANLEEANRILENNAREESVVKVGEGKVQYKVISEGQGSAVPEHGNPTISYRGTYSDGTLFGSSDETGPVAVPLDQTVPGFAKGLVGMKEGEKRRIYIHPDEAYGVMGHLPPNSLLIFDVEVIRANSIEFDQPVAESDEGTEPGNQG